MLVSHWIERCWNRIFMQLLASRDYPVIDYQTMGEFIGRERLFRAPDGSFLLHMSSKGKLEVEGTGHLADRARRHMLAQ
jgi:hypothetical protein